jgi:DNA polymerase-4
VGEQHADPVLGARVLHLRVRPGTPPERYQALLDLLVSEISPVVQALPPAAVLVDVAGALRFHRRTPAELASLIRLRAVAWFDTDVHIGVAPNWALAATASTRPGPNGTRVVVDDPLAIADFLWPLPVEDLHGIGRQQAATLRGFGIYTVGALAGLPEATAQRILGGQLGRLLRDRAWGLDPPTALPRSTSERRDFDRDELDPDVVRTAILDAAYVVACRLRERGQAATGLELQLRFAGESQLTRSRRLTTPSAHTEDLRDAGFELFARLGLQRARIRGVSVRATELVDADRVAEQITFDRRTENGRRAESAVDKANRRFGAGTVRPARLAGPRRAA